LEFETVEARHSHIEEETAPYARIILRQEFFCGRKHSDSESSRTQQTGDRATYRRVIIN
jgi:hypothetical protein